MTTVYNFFQAITKSDTADLPLWLSSGRLTDAVLVGGAGIVAAVDQDGTVTNLTAVAGEILPIAIRRVNEANTTATAMTALYAR